MGYCASPTLTTLGVLRTEGTPEDQQDEGLGIHRGRRRRAFIRATQPGVSRRPEGTTTFPRRPGPGRPRRRFGLLRRVGRRALERERIRRAEQAAAEAAAIAEAERLARAAVIPPVTDVGAGRPAELPVTRTPCGPVPDRRRGWSCVNGRWEYRSPGAPTTDIRPTPPTIPERARPSPRPPEVPGAPIEPIPTVRPWWMGRAPVGEIPLRDTSGIPTPPGLGPTMRPPPSYRDTPTERVAPPPAARTDMGKLILPLVAGAAALMFLR